MDALIDEILLMSRLDSGSHADLSQDIDLVALAAEEGARYPDCLLSGGAPGISGDPRLLRRLVRNLLENAHNHGAPPVEIELSSTAKTDTLMVRDVGDGVPEAGREKVFQPFYRASDCQNVPLVRAGPAAGSTNCRGARSHNRIAAAIGSTICHSGHVSSTEVRIADADCRALNLSREHA